MGDFIEVLSFSKDNSMKVEGKNLRTGQEGFLHWNTFRKVNTRNVCGCNKVECYCIYEDFNKSMKAAKGVWG